MHQGRRSRLTGADIPDTRRLVRTCSGELPSIRAENCIRDRAAVPGRRAHLLAFAHIPDLRAVMPFPRKDVVSTPIKSGRARPNERRYPYFALAGRRPV